MDITRTSQTWAERSQSRHTIGGQGQGANVGLYLCAAPSRWGKRDRDRLYAEVIAANKQSEAETAQKDFVWTMTSKSIKATPWQSVPRTQSTFQRGRHMRRSAHPGFARVSSAHKSAG